jgi:crotonobetainyl-CoA:carnitine CoA-transferase CaiB-like acyl-CoA transferase
MYPDAVAGLTGFAAIVAALHYRNRTGEGQYIDLSMQEANLSFVGDAALEYSLTGRQRPRLGSRHLTFAPHGIYACAGTERGEEQWLALAAESEEQWAALSEASGHPEWREDPRFCSNAARKANEDALDEAIEAWTRGEAGDALAARLAAAGVPAAAVLDAREVAQDPHLRQRGVVVDVDHPEAGRWAQAGVPFHFSRTPIRVTRHAPTQGEHNVEVYRELLGMDDDEYDSLVSKGVTGVGPPD